MIAGMISAPNLPFSCMVGLLSSACGWPPSGIVRFPSLLHAYHMAQCLQCILSMAFGVKLVDGAPGCMVMIMLIMPGQIRTSLKQGEWWYVVV